MARTNAQKKGDALENAVQMIEEEILRTNPTTKEALITIETRKKIIIDGVTHEIDVFVTIDYGKGYKSIFIFECKNWEDTVGKSEIVSFSDKIQEVQAQKGYFIAKKYSKDAINKAKKDKRIELLKATDELEVIPEFLMDFHYVHNNVLNTRLSFTVQTDDPEKVGTVPFHDESKVKLGDEDLLLSVLTERVRQHVIAEVMKDEATQTFEAGLYQYDKMKQFVFDPGELYLDGYACLEFSAQIVWETQIIRPIIMSKFDVLTRGRVITYTSGELSSGGTIQVSFVKID